MASCRDRAGNSAARSFALKYDAAAPTATSAQAGTRCGCQRLVQPRRRGRVQRDRPALGRRPLHGGHLRRARQRQRLAARHVHGPGGQRQPGAGVRPQVRRDEAGRERRPARARVRLERLVQPRGRRRLLGVRSDRGRRELHERHLRGARQRRGLAGRDVPGPGRQRQRSARLRVEVRRVRAAGDRGGSGSRRPTRMAGSTVPSASRSGAATRRRASRRVRRRATAGRARRRRASPGTCRDVAGNTASRAFALQYDDVAPTVTKGTRGARGGRGRLVQPPGRDRLRGSRRALGCVGLLDGHLRRARQRGGIAGGDVHRSGGQRQRAARVRAEVRRVGADGDWWHPGACRGRQRLVQPRRSRSRSPEATRSPA